jgi:hypothetical protein
MTTSLDRTKFSKIIARLAKQKGIRPQVAGELEIGGKEYICIPRNQWDAHQEIWQNAFETYLKEMHPPQPPIDAATKVTP